MARDAKITSKIMSCILSKNTKPEQLLGSSMWKIGLRYRKHYKITGTPDFVFVKLKIAIFCDGDFWHGNNWKIRGLKNFDEELKGYNPYWKDKILKNVDRDQNVNLTLKNEGWLVLRFWESDIKNSLEDITNEILKKVIERKKNCTTIDI